MTNKVLLVDSSNYDVANTQCKLEEQGYTVCNALPGSALGVAKLERPDLIFLDYAEQGLGTCQALQSDLQTRDIPIIIMCGKEKDREGTLTALKFGCIDFIKDSDKEDYILNKLGTYLRFSKIKSLAKRLNQVIK